MKTTAEEDFEPEEARDKLRNVESESRPDEGDEDGYADPEGNGGHGSDPAEGDIGGEDGFKHDVVCGFIWKTLCGFVQGSGVAQVAWWF